MSEDFHITADSIADFLKEYMENQTRLVEPPRNFMANVANNIPPDLSLTSSSASRGFVPRQPLAHVTNGNSYISQGLTVSGFGNGTVNCAIPNVAQSVGFTPSNSAYSQAGRARHYQRMTSADARIDDFLKNLDAADANVSTSTPMIRALTDNDPQTLEINRLIQELGSLQDLDVNTNTHQERPNLQGQNIQSESMVTSSSLSELESPLKSRNYCTNSPQRQLNEYAKPFDKHPTLADLLLNGADSSNSPPKPLPDKPFHPSGDIEGTLLLIKHAKDCQVESSEQWDIKKTNLIRAQSLGDINANLSINTSTKPPNVMLGQGTMLASPPQSSPLSDLLNMDPRRDKVQKTTSPGISEPDVIIIDEPVQRPVNAIAPRRDFNRHPLTMEEKLRITALQNHKLNNVNIQLLRENNLLRQEVIYLRDVIRNKSGNANVMQAASQLTTQFDAKRKSTYDSVSVEDLDVKKIKVEPGMASFVSGCGCLHVNPGSKLASIELCAQCQSMSGTQQPR